MPSATWKGPTYSLLPHAVPSLAAGSTQELLEASQITPEPSITFGLPPPSKQGERVLVSSSSHNVGPFLCLPVDKVVQISYS